MKPLHCANCGKPALSFLFVGEDYYCPVCYADYHKTMKRINPDYLKKGAEDYIQMSKWRDEDES